MTVRTFAALLVLVLAASPVRAQEAEGQRPSKVSATQAQTSPKGPPPQARAPEVPARPMRAVANVEIALTITDYVGAGAPLKKTVSMIAADGSVGRVRTTVGAVGATLNVDATPIIVEGDRVRLQLTLEYAPPDERLRSNETAPPRPAVVNEMLTIVLANGRSMVISHAADPASDRKVTVEVQASILK